MRRFLTVVGIGVLFVLAGAKLNRLPQAEQKHFLALRVFMSDTQQKAFLKLKTSAERDAYLTSEGLWELFYRHDETTRSKIVQGRVSRGWDTDMVLMAWGKPFRRQRSAARAGGQAEKLTYRFEVSPDGMHKVSPPKSKTAHQAVEKYSIEVLCESGVVVEMSQLSGWL